MATTLFLLLTYSFWCCQTQENGYELVDTDTRNIIFVGRSRAGKSTAIEVLKDKSYDPGPFTLLRGTTDPSISSFTVNSKKYGRNLHLKIMDTPGLFERAAKDDQRTNEVILDVIRQCIDKGIGEIHHVYYVMSIQRGLSEEDLRSFDLFTELFIGMDNKISIIFVIFSENDQRERGSLYRSISAQSTCTKTNVQQNRRTNLFFGRSHTE